MSRTLGSEDIDEMQDANLNSGTLILKIRISAQFVSHDFFEMHVTPFHTQNIFISKVKHILNTIIAFKASGCDCTNNNELLHKIGV